MTNNLDRGQRSARGKRPKGRTSERRARQAALISGWQPWRRSTGPWTEAGKARCAMNALTHGFRSRAYLHKAQRVRHAIRLAASNNAIVSAFIRNAARPWIRIKPSYAKSAEAQLVLRSLGGGGRAKAELVLRTPDFDPGEGG